MLLAADVGGTKTLIGLFDQLPVRPRALAVRKYATLDYASLDEILAVFKKDEDLSVPIASACFGVAGPVKDHAAQLTNVPWRIDGRDVAHHHSIERVAVLNDLAAMSFALPLLDDNEVHVLQQGEASHSGNVALIAAGTGLGETLLHFIDGDYVPVSSESGHADFAARSDLEIALLQQLTALRGRASVEDVVSGQGLVRFHSLTHNGPCPALLDRHHPEAAALISAAALEHRCPGCVSALEAFVGAYGAEAGNLALRTLAVGGVFIGGGIAPKILPALSSGALLRAFSSKSPFEDVLQRIPVKVVLNHHLGLLGAAVYAARLHAGRAAGVP